MANVDTVKAVTANIGSILTALGLKVEDASSNHDITTASVAQIHYDGERFEYAFGQKPLYNTIEYVIKVFFNDPAPGTSRDKQAGWVHSLRDNITVNALNVGSLAVSKLVLATLHNGAQVVYDAPTTTIEYKLDVRYREV